MKKVIVLLAFMIANFAIEAQIEKPPSTIAADLKRGNGHYTFIGGR